uniref:FecCD family ABC transporter permease n=1 Tax=Halomonas sp. TaxID=1486246 RepID=UPI0026204B2F|nr:iron ABC transporter permease [Halomonas sp.]
MSQEHISQKHMNQTLNMCGSGRISGRNSYPAQHAKRRAQCILLSLGALLLASAWLSLSLGSYPTHPLKVLEALVAPATSDIGFIIWELRLPRIVLAILVGAALASAGAILQGIVRNPLASPDVIGITGGASVAAVLFLVSLSTTLSMLWLPVAAILGAFAAALVVFALAWRKGMTPTRLVLVGVGISAAMGAVTTLLIVLSDDTLAMNAYVWLTGSIYAAQWGDIQGLLPWLVLFIPLALLHSRHMDTLSLGDDTATGLGVNVTRSRLLLMICSVALAGSAVAFAGGLSFVGLVAPHIARRLIGRGFALLLPVSALVGGLIVLYADLLGRVAFLPRDLPAGIFVSGIGAPFFVYLLYRIRQ